MSKSSVPPVLPGRLLDHVLAFRRDPVRPFVDAMRVGAPLVGLRVGLRGIYAACDMDTVHEVFVKGNGTFGKNTRGAALLRAVVGNSMLTADGEVWRQRRKLAQPAFMRTAVGAFAGTMERASDDLAERWARSPGTIAVDEATMDLALRVACEALFGADLGERGEAVHRALSGILAVFIPLVGLPLPSPERWPIPSARQLRRGVAELDRVVHAMVAERRAAGGGGDDLLGRLMEAREEGVVLDDAALRDEVVTLLLAGHETTANALAWTLALLSRHPEAARRLEAEVDAVGSVATEPTPFLDAVLKESLRLYPPAWILARSANVDTEVAGFPIRKGDFVFGCTYALHRGPWWENPEGFDPDRWLVGGAPKADWIPFGIGGRKCIGEAFAMLEARIALASIARRVRVSLVPGQELIPVPTVTLRPKGPLWMTVRPREGRRSVLASAPSPRPSAGGGCPVHASAK